MQALGVTSTWRLARVLGWGEWRECQEGQPTTASLWLVPVCKSKILSALGETLGAAEPSRGFLEGLGESGHQSRLACNQSLIFYPVLIA